MGSIAPRSSKTLHSFSTLYTKGLHDCRISYWPGISFLSPLEIQNLGNDMTLFGLKSSQPAIELGLNPNGLLESRHSPSLSLINSDGNFGGDLRFEIEMHTADMQGLILQAASKNADLQLGEKSFLPIPSMIHWMDF